MANPLQQLAQHGQSPWYDNIQRGMLNNGDLAKMVMEDGLKGVTSNPSIFEKSIVGSDDYEQALRKLIGNGKLLDSEQVFFHLAIEDIRAAADIFSAVYAQSEAIDGMVSLEVSPELANDTEATVAQARELHKWVARPNLMIKVPATAAGVAAVELLTADGINVNATLLFSVDRYKEIAQAYVRGLQARHKQGKAINRVASVASFFVSRVDSAVDKLIAAKMHDDSAPALRPLVGETAIANAKIAYQTYQDIFSAVDFAQLKVDGARVQRLLWASTGTKNPQFSDVRYIDALIGPDTVSTIPPATYAAFKDHGTVSASLAADVDQARDVLTTLANNGIDLQQVTLQLEEQGVLAFADAFRRLLAAIAKQIAVVRERV